MLKRTLNFCLLKLAIFFIASNICLADSIPEDGMKPTAPDAANKTASQIADTAKPEIKAPPKEKSKKKKLKKGVKNTQETAEKSGEQTSPNKAEGPSYPFVHERNGADHLACKVTPFIEPLFDNKKPMRKGNNLLRKPGSPLKASGNYIQISGMVVDENCLPIQGVVVEIWQTDTNGHYEWEYDRESCWKLPTAGKDNNFLYSGSAHTDNLGAFDFMTMMPSSHGGEAPYINLIVKREGYEELHTRMYFSGQNLNDSDKSLAELSEGGRASLIIKGRPIDPAGHYEGREYYFPITLGGISPYKRF
jgi:protocatechuate 3,4-dioxygenase beta subunit